MAKIIWQIKLDTESLSAEFDEQLRMISAFDRKSAYHKAIQIGLHNEETFLNTKGKQISWHYVNVEFVKEISSFDDGLEICANTLKVENAAAYIEEINIKAQLNSDALLLV